MAATVDFSDFIPPDTQGRGILTVYLPDGTTYCFKGLDLEVFSVTCPLLALSFEEGPRGRQLHSLQATSVELVSRFLRFLYTGHYSIINSKDEQLPVSLLTHAQLYHYADLYDMHPLLDSAYYNISRELEVVCSLPNPHAELCDAIKFVYEHYKNGQEVREAFLHYCVNCFAYHRLGQREDFKQLLAEQKSFRQDLFRVNMERGFSDEGSRDLIQLQLPNGPHQSDIPAGDFVYDMFGSNNSTPFQTPLLSPTHPSPDPSFKLVHRPRRLGKMPCTDSDGYSSEDSMMSDFEGFSLVGRPKPSFMLPGRIKRPPRSRASATNDHSDSSGSDWSVLSVPTSKAIPAPRSLLGEALAMEKAQADGRTINDSHTVSEETALCATKLAEVGNNSARSIGEEPLRLGVHSYQNTYTSAEPRSSSSFLYSRPDLGGSAETIVAIDEQDEGIEVSESGAEDEGVDDSAFEAENEEVLTNFEGDYKEYLEGKAKETAVGNAMAGKFEMEQGIEANDWDAE